MQREFSTLAFEAELGDIYDQFNKLKVTLESIQSTQSLTQAVALESQQLFAESKLPDIYFSNLPSAQKYRQALEEMTEGLAGLIVGVIAVLVILIIKAITWFQGRGGKGGGGGGGGGYEFKFEIKHELKPESKRGYELFIGSEKHNNLALFNKWVALAPYMEVLAEKKQYYKDFQQAIETLKRMNLIALAKGSLNNVLKVYEDCVKKHCVDEASPSISHEEVVELLKEHTKEVTSEITSLNESVTQMKTFRVEQLNNQNTRVPDQSDLLKFARGLEFAQLKMSTDQLAFSNSQMSCKTELNELKTFIERDFKHKVQSINFNIPDGKLSTKQTIDSTFSQFFGKLVMEIVKSATGLSFETEQALHKFHDCYNTYAHVTNKIISLGSK